MNNKISESTIRRIRYDLVLYEYLSRRTIYENGYWCLELREMKYSEFVKWKEI